MTQRITIDPITRISGFLEISAELDQNTIVDAQAKGLLFRGFETMLKGRQPLDAVFFTERICGICSAAHSFASTLALEDALHVYTSNNDKYLREIIHGFEFVQNHLRHFYLMLMPCFVKITSPPIVNVEQYSDFRIPEEGTARLQEHYRQGIEFSMLAHEGQAVLGAKAPHHHGIFPGGVVSDLTAYKIVKVRSYIRQLLTFVSTVMREDTEVIAYYYPDYYEMGISYPNFLSYGVFDNAEESIHYVGPGVLMNGELQEFSPDNITKQVNYAWFNSSNEADEVNPEKKDAYTFIKAPRYANNPMEVGPLARMLISGNYQGGHSCMDRIYARMLETEKILNIMNNLTDLLELLPNGQRRLSIPDISQGAGLVDTTRGSLGHWISIGNKVIDHYSIITPSNWNLSPKDADGNPGVIEKALIGTVIADINSPVEIGRIVRSFDPCVSCATHLIGRNGDRITIELPV
ncbi:MAG TPA: nickel-dependent hydrogenase large subunit [Mobilitalea sp.]|nr:nickel-dependent hydrogenase large subunit [Mobilitalea sp.]